jgi:hypothetical protein
MPEDPLNRDVLQVLDRLAKHQHDLSDSIAYRQIAAAGLACLYDIARSLRQLTKLQQALVDQQRSAASAPRSQP